MQDSKSESELRKEENNKEGTKLWLHLSYITLLSISDARDTELCCQFIGPVIINLSHIKENKLIYMKDKGSYGKW